MQTEYRIENYKYTIFSPFIATKYAKFRKLEDLRSTSLHVYPTIQRRENRRKLTARLTTKMIKLPHAGKFPTCPLAFQIA